MKTTSTLSKEIISVIRQQEAVVPVRLLRRLPSGPSERLQGRHLLFHVDRQVWRNSGAHVHRLVRGDGAVLDVRGEEYFARPWKFNRSADEQAADSQLDLRFSPVHSRFGYFHRSVLVKKILTNIFITTTVSKCIKSEDTF